MTRPLALTAINHPYAGLGNRMRFTLSALEIARTTGRDFSFYWPTNDNFQPALTDLWHFPHREIPKDTIPPKFTEKDDLTKLDEVPNWAIRSDARLTYNGRERHWGAALRELQPHGDVKARTDAVLHELPESFVAVQVRLGPRAPQKCLKHSPIEWYISRMRQIRESRPNTHFFISSDSTDALEQLLAEFPDSAHLPKRGGHNTLEARARSDDRLLCHVPISPYPCRALVVIPRYGVAVGQQALGDRNKSRPAAARITRPPEPAIMASRAGRADGPQGQVVSARRILHL